MASKRYKPEEIVRLLKQAKGMHGRGMTMADAIRPLGISEVMLSRRPREHGGMSGGQLRRLGVLTVGLPVAADSRRAG